MHKLNRKEMIKSIKNTKKIFVWIDFGVQGGKYIKINKSDLLMEISGDPRLQSFSVEYNAGKTMMFLHA